MSDLTIIAGQKPVVTKAKKSIAAVQGARRHGDRRHGDAARRAHVGVPGSPDSASRCRVSATSRASRRKSFDGRGNYTLGLREQLVFPEIDYDKIDRLRGLEISIVTTARTDEEAAACCSCSACRSAPRE